MTQFFHRCVLVAIMAISSQSANAQMSSYEATGDYASDLGSLYGVMKTTGYTRDICSEQFHDMQRRLDEAYSNWRQRYKPFLQEIALRFNLELIEISN